MQITALKIRYLILTLFLTVAAIFGFVIFTHSKLPAPVVILWGGSLDEAYSQPYSDKLPPVFLEYHLDIRKISDERFQDERYKSGNKYQLISVLYDGRTYETRNFNLLISQREYDCIGSCNHWVLGEFQIKMKYSPQVKKYQLLENNQVLAETTAGTPK